MSASLTPEQLTVSLSVTYSAINREENERFKPSLLAMQKIEVM